MFPDQAVLPSGASAGSASAGSANSAGSASAGAGGDDATPGGSGTGGVAAGAGGAGGTTEPSGGAGADAGGAGGTPSCDDPQTTPVTLSADSWIDASNPGAGNGSATTLSVVGGAAEHRALLSLSLPVPPPGAFLLRATLRLQLQTNADATLASRQLGLHRLQRQFVENRASWTNWSNGQPGKWSEPGGDFGELQAQATVAPGTAAGPVEFDITPLVALEASTQPVPLSLIVLELGSAPAAPAALAFTSREGDASAPVLLIDYCAP